MAGLERHIRNYRNGRDLTDAPRGVMVIDLYGLSEAEVRKRFPAVYQWLLERVKPERDNNNRESRKRNWWLFGETNPKLRAQLSGLPRYIATVETAKHRTFQFLPADILPDNKLIAIALDDAFSIGVLSSRPHVAWALAVGSWLGVGNDPVYVKTRCFETFPFPVAKANDKRRIAALAEEIDAQRKRQQAAHPALSLTGMYNVLEKLRAGEVLSTKEKAINDQGLIATLKNLHDQLDAAVLAAYGWDDLAPALARGPLDEATRQTLLARLAALNVERAHEEAEGTVRWLRPEYQAPAEAKSKEKATTQGKQAAFAIGGEDEAPAVDGARHPWPAQLAEQVRAVADLLAASEQSLTEDEIAARFSGKGPWKKRLPQIVETLVALGRARRQDRGISAG